MNAPYSPDHSSQSDGHLSDASDKDTTAAMKNQAQDVSEDLKHATDEAVAEAKRKTQQLTEEARQRAEEAIQQQKNAAALQMEGIADALYDTAGKLTEEQAWLANGMHRAGDFIEQLSGSVKERNLSDLMHDLEHYTRRQPGVVIGAAAVTGFLLSRFLKSSVPSASTPTTARQHVNTAPVSNRPYGAAAADTHRPQSAGTHQ